MNYKFGIYENSKGVRIKVQSKKKELGENVYTVYFTNVYDRTRFRVTTKGLKNLLKGFKWQY